MGKHYIYICIALVLFPILISETVKAQPSDNFDYNPGRPAFTTGSGILVPKTLSIESGFIFDFGLNENNNTWSNYYSIRYAPLKNLELNTSVSYSSDLPSTYVNIDSWSLSAKVNLLQGKGNGSIGIALFAGLSVPLKKDIESQRFYPSPTLALFFDHAWDRISLSYNIGMDGIDNIFYSIYADIAVHKRFCLYVEGVGNTTFGQTPLFGKTSFSSVFIQAGVAAFATKNLKFDLSLGSVLLDQQANSKPNLFMEVGLAYGIPLAKSNK